MTCKFSAAFPAMLLLAACNQNAPTDTEAPTEAGATTPAAPATEPGSRAGVPDEGAAQPVPDEYAQEGATTQ